MASSFKNRIDRIIKQYSQDSGLKCTRCSGTLFDVDGSISFQLDYARPIAPDILISDFSSCNATCRTCGEDAVKEKLTKDDLILLAFCKNFERQIAEKFDSKLKVLDRLLDITNFSLER
jgi:hypothetical protein